MIVLTYCSTLCIFKLKTKFKAIYIKLDYFINELSKILCEERILILSIHPYNFSFFVALMIELSERFFSGILSHLKSPTWLAPWNDTRNLTIWNYFLFVLNSSSDFSRCRPTWRAQLSTRSSRPRGNRWGMHLTACSVYFYARPISGSDWLLRQEEMTQYGSIRCSIYCISLFIYFVVGEMECV